jgi:hypothetical protein
MYEANLMSVLHASATTLVITAASSACYTWLEHAEPATNVLLEPRTLHASCFSCLCLSSDTEVATDRTVKGVTTRAWEINVVTQG